MPANKEESERAKVSLTKVSFDQSCDWYPGENRALRARDLDICCHWPQIEDCICASPRVLLPT
eukprot:7220172-Lingulodinium_polyedra.AAC.1